jgi:Zn-dependent peptidase ImmA (M78 family)
MASVLISAARFRSMLANRHKEVGQVASELDTHADLVLLAESDTEIEFEDLERLARYFKRPWSYLLLDEPEHFSNLGQDHRTHFNQLVSASADLMAELDGALQTLNAAAELFPEDGYQIPASDLNSDLPPATVGTKLRSFLGVSDQAQTSAKDDYAALRLWVDALERRGVYVSQRSLSDPTIRAFSKTEEGQAVVVIDTGDGAYARIFSLLHEYSHVLLRSTGICDLDQHDSVERYCNRVAASALLPLDLLSREMGVWRYGLDAEADDAKVRRLSERLRVSQAALLIRLEEAGWISEHEYEALESRRRTRRGQEKKSGGSFYPGAINRAGRRFSRNVFGVLDEGVIDRSDAATLLGIGEHLVPRYRRELFGDHGDTR